MSPGGLNRILGLLLVAGTLTAYWYLQHCGFIHFDDPFYVTGNDHVRGGLSRTNVIWAFTAFHSSNWHPLTWLSHMLDCDLYGLNPAGHHLTSLFFHVGNTLLLFLFLREATNQPWRSFVVAALFSLHPLHVESVAWVSERKDVLSTFFWMLALVAYLRYVMQPGIYRYLLVVLLFVLGLMAKPMVVTLPFVLMLVDYWPLRRFSLSIDPSRSGFVKCHVSPGTMPFRRLLLEKVPFLFLLIPSIIVTLLAQVEGRAVRTLEVIPFATRLANAVISYVHYPVAMLWPHDLSIFYPHPLNTLSPWLVAVSALLLTASTLMAIRTASRNPYVFVGWLWYLATLVPVIGLVQVGDQAMADRYTYIPLVGLFIAVVWGFSDLLARCQVRRIVKAALVFAVCFALCILTQSQLQHWQNSGTLFRHALKVNDRNYLAHLAIAQAMKLDGDSDGASFHEQKAEEINPGFVAKMHNRWGYSLAEQGQLDEAISDFEEAIRICPDYANAHNNLGVVLARKGQFDEAMAHFAEALRISPGNPGVLKAIEITEAERNRSQSAMNH